MDALTPGTGDRGAMITGSSRSTRADSHSSRCAIAIITPGADRASSSSRTFTTIEPSASTVNPALLGRRAASSPNGFFSGRTSRGPGIEARDRVNAAEST